MIHEIIALIRTKSDIDNVLKNLNIKQQYGTLIFQDIRLQITRIINHKALVHLFQPNLKTFSETSILAPEGSIYRPDRVIEHSSDLASLIDYKTGKEERSHFQQMNRYEDILLDLGYAKVEKYLVYLATGNVKKI